MDGTALIMAQYSQYSQNGGGTMGMLLPIINLVMAIFFCICYYGIFTKAGKPGWLAFIPFANIWVLYEVCYGDGKGWKFLVVCALMIIPIVNIIALILLPVRIAQAFGQGILGQIATLFLPIIMLPLFAFGNYEYHGPCNDFL